MHYGAGGKLRLKDSLNKASVFERTLQAAKSVPRVNCELKVSLSFEEPTDKPVVLEPGLSSLGGPVQHLPGRHAARCFKQGAHGEAPVQTDR